MYHKRHRGKDRVSFETVVLFALGGGSDTPARI
jgi:hypothetical protein